MKDSDKSDLLTWSSIRPLEKIAIYGGRSPAGLPAVFFRMCSDNTQEKLVNSKCVLQAKWSLFHMERDDFVVFAQKQQFEVDDAEELFDEVAKTTAVELNIRDPRYKKIVKPWLRQNEIALKKQTQLDIANNRKVECRMKASATFRSPYSHSYESSKSYRAVFAMQTTANKVLIGVENMCKTCTRGQVSFRGDFIGPGTYQAGPHASIHTCELLSCRYMDGKDPTVVKFERGTIDRLFSINSKCRSVI